MFSNFSSVDSFYLFWLAAVDVILVFPAFGVFLRKVFVFCRFCVWLVFFNFSYFLSILFSVVNDSVAFSILEFYVQGFLPVLMSHLRLFLKSPSVCYIFGWIFNIYLKYI